MPAQYVRNQLREMPTVLLPTRRRTYHIPRCLQAYVDSFLFPTVPRLLMSAFILSPCSVTTTAPVSVSFAFGPHSSAGAVNATVRDWASGITVSFTLTLFPKVLNAKQGNSMDV